MSTFLLQLWLLLLCILATTDTALLVASFSFTVLGLNNKNTPTLSNEAAIRTERGVVLQGSYYTSSFGQVEEAASPPNNEDGTTTVSRDLGPLITQDPSFQAFLAGSIPLVCIPQGALPKDLLKDLIFDSTCLQRAGFGDNKAGVASGKMSSIRKDVHQIWLQSPTTTSSLSEQEQRPPEPLVGNMDARKRLYQFIEDLRQVLEEEKTSTIISGQEKEQFLLPHQFVELSYLLYKPGAYYRRHVDTIARTTNGMETVSSGRATVSERRVSLLLYLGDANDDREWNCDVDGGALRVYGDPPTDKTTTMIRMRTDETNSSSSIMEHEEELLHHYLDIQPTAGTLVLFDSSQVPHEVLQTLRSRVCVVGWFRSVCG